MLNRFTISIGIFLSIIIAIGVVAEPVLPTKPTQPSVYQPSVQIQTIKPEVSSFDALEIACGAFLIYGEARNQSLVGKRAVMEVGLNRRDNKYYPDTLCEVVFQPKQFSFANAGDPNRPKTFAAFLKGNDEHTASARIIAYHAYYRPASERIVHGLHYHTNAVKPAWIGSMPKTGRTNIDDHIFHNSQKP